MTVRSRGFTMVEVFVAMFVLTVGLVSLSSLPLRLSVARRFAFLRLGCDPGVGKARGPEPLADGDPDVYVSSGTAGSLSSDVQNSVTAPLDTETINYYDNVYITDNTFFQRARLPKRFSACGAWEHTPRSLTTRRNPDGNREHQRRPPVTNVITFHRRWTIEANQPVSGVERITVLVTLLNQYVQPGVSYQMSFVRAASQ